MGLGAKAVIPSVLLLVSALAGGARANVVLDQSAVPTSAMLLAGGGFLIGVQGGTVADDAAQVFTPAISGTLSSISVYMAQTTASQPLIVDIRAVTGGVPQVGNTPLLGSVQLAPSLFPQDGTPYRTNPTFTSIDFSSQNIAVQAGVPLAIVMRSNQPTDAFANQYDWFGSNQGVQIYSGGDAFTRIGGSTNAWFGENGPTDYENLSFEEFVTVPEPRVAVSILAVGWLLLGRGYRRARA